MDRWQLFDTIWKILLFGGTVYVILCFSGFMKKEELGLLIVGIICVVNYFKGSFVTDSKRVIFSIMLLAAILLWDLFDFLISQGGF